jgi:acyl-CoA reductase-like NAD-dependent aldehyde dehydrogenase
VEKVSQLVTGDPLDEATHVGPLITLADRDRVKAWVDEAVSAGARLLLGSGVEGTLLKPTVLADVTPAMKVFCKEVFGPVVGITRSARWTRRSSWRTPPSTVCRQGCSQRLSISRLR